jgi:hypothetical protein
MNLFNDEEDAALRRMIMKCPHGFHRPKTKTPEECAQKLNQSWQALVQGLQSANRK